VNGCRVQKNGFNISKVDPDSDRACAFARPFFIQLDEPSAVEFRDP
jgi:hypothetical protein